MMRCQCERISLCTGNGETLGYIRTLGESIRVGRKDPRRGTAGQILGDPGRRGQAGEAQIRAQAERNTGERNSGKDETDRHVTCIIFCG